jgi:hypothetical protein
MENKNNSSISNKMSLIETYNESLNEDLISKAALEGKLIASELEGYLKMMMKDGKISTELTNAGIRTSEELLTALKGNRLTSTLKGSLELSILKSNTKNAKLIDLATENLVRNKAFDQKYAAEFAKGQPAYEKALKQAGYSEDAITKIVQKKFNLPTAKPLPSKPTTPPPPPPANIKNLWTKFGDKIKELLKNKPNWKQLVLKVAGLGIGAAALWYMIDSFMGDEKPADTPPVPPADTKWDPCINELIKSGEAQTTTDVNAVIVKPTDFPDGLEFFNNGRVMDIAGKKMGTWKCKGTTPVISESQKISLNGLLDEQENIKTAKEVDTMYVRKKSSSDIADITWDGQNKPVKKSKYHDCSGKDTFEFGCRATKIKEIQKCLGMEERYQTGNFGPLTKKALGDAGYDVNQGITVDIYNKIKASCTDNSNVRAPKLDNAKIEPIKTDLTPKAAGINTDNLKMPNIQPLGQGNQGESIYKGLKNNFTDKTLPYIFSSGDRIKYKGDEIGEGSLGQLDQYLSTLGYQRIKEKDKDYGVKYVWAKQ